MYIPLTSENNTKLIDPHGGVHHIKDLDVKFIGDHKDKLKDQNTVLRYARFLARTDKNPDPKVKTAVEEIKEMPIM